MDNKYYTVTSIDLAKCLVWITGQNYLVFDSLNDKNKKVYSFNNSLELQLAIQDIHDLRKKYRK